ncbi:MAG: glycosyltransferase [Limisphaerales bacterium]
MTILFVSAAGIMLKAFPRDASPARLGGRVVHSIHFPVSARNFVAPMVEHLNRSGIAAELWFENRACFAQIISGINVPQRHIETDVCVNPIVFCRRVARYRRRLRQTRPAVVHAHQTRATLVPLLAARLAGVPIRVYHNHGLAYLGYRGPLRQALRALERTNLRLATHALLVSHSNLNAARADGLLAEGKGIVLANGSAAGIDLNAFAPERFDRQAAAASRARIGAAEGAFVLGFVGRPLRRKGFHRLLEAWEQSASGRANGLLLAAGCSQAECDEALGRPIPGVRGLGYLPDLTGLYAAVDAVVLPSDHEGFPYSLLEGGAAGRALLGTDIPGIRCAIRHEQTGLLVAPDSVGALRGGIERLAANPGLRGQLGRNARARVEKEFARPVVLEALLEFYRNALGLKPAPPSAA